jgi:hypothetical protein
VLALLLGGGLLLHVPFERVPLVYDMLGYAAQGHGILTGHGNTVALGERHLPGIYPAGVPALAAAAMALLGPDLRHGLAAVLLCAVGTLLCVHLCVRRAGGSAWAGLAALLLVFSSLAFRTTSGFLMSQVPTALAVALATLLWLSLRSGTALFLAGLVAMLSVLLRYANVSFPAALFAAEILLGGHRPRPRLRSLLLVSAGLGAGAAAVLAHNAWCYGDPLTTGYAVWGWNVEGQFGWHNILWAPGAGSFRERNVLLSAFAGLSDLQSVPMSLAAVAGLVLCWREGRERPQARLLAGLCFIAVAATYLLLAGYAFRSESYLVPTVPLTAMLAGYGLARAARLAGAGREGLAPLLALLLVAASLWRAPGPSEAELEAIARHASLAESSRLAEPDAVLITTADPALVEPVWRAGLPRTVLYLGPYVSKLIEECALAELGTEKVWPNHVVDWARAHARAGRAVYLDQNPPPRGLLGNHVAVRTALRAAFVLAPAGAPNVFRLSRADLPRPPPPEPPPVSDPSGR